MTDTTVIPDKVTARLGDITAATRLKLEEVWLAAVEAGLTPSFAWGWGPNPEHNSRRALDFMVYRTDGTTGINSRAGDFIRNYLWAHRARLGVRHVLWERQITSTTNHPGVVRTMASRGNVTADHYDHVHVLFLDDRYAAPSGYTGSGGSTAPTPTGPNRLKIDGKLGPATIRRWQQVMGTTPDGEISYPYSSLVAAVQRRLNRTGAKLRADGKGIASNNDGRYPTQGTTNTIKAVQRHLRVTADGYLSSPRSETVKALQRRLNEGKF